MSKRIALLAIRDGYLSTQRDRTQKVFRHEKMESFRKHGLFEFIEFLSELGVYLGDSGWARNAGARKILERSRRITFCIQKGWSIGLNDYTKHGFIIRMHTKIPLACNPADRFCTMEEFLFSTVQHGGRRLIVYLLFQDAKHVWPRVLIRGKGLCPVWH